MEKKLEQSSADRAWVFCFPDTEYALERTVIFPEKDLSTFLVKATLKIKLPCKLTSEDLAQKEHEHTRSTYPSDSRVGSEPGKDLNDYVKLGIRFRFSDNY